MEKKESLKKEIEQEEADRTAVFKKELKELISKYDCLLIPFVVIEGGQVIADIKIKANRIQ